MFKFILICMKRKNHTQIHNVDEEPFWQGTILPEDYRVKQDK